MAGEVESLDTEEPLRRHVARHNYDRLIMLSDGIFAIAATLLALGIAPPERWDGNLWLLLQQEWRSLFGFLFGFFVVASFWMAHRNIFARLRRVDMPATLLTLLLLCLVSLVPAAAALVADYGPARAMMVYFSLASAIALVQLILWWWVAYKRRMTHPDLGREERASILAQSAMLLTLSVTVVLLIGTGLGDWAFLPIILLTMVALLIRRYLRRRLVQI